MGYAYWCGDNKNLLIQEDIFEIGRYYVQIKIYLKTSKSYDVYLVKKIETKDDYPANVARYELFKIDQKDGTVQQNITSLFLQTKQLQNIVLHANIVHNCNKYLKIFLLNESLLFPRKSINKLNNSGKFNQ